VKHGLPATVFKDHPGDPDPARLMIGTWFPGFFKKGSGKHQKNRSIYQGVLLEMWGSSGKDKTKKKSNRDYQ